MNPSLKVPYGCLKNESITYLLPNTVNKIGRNPLTNTVILNHNSISKEHALIEFDSNRQGYISDLFSSNGTFVNGIKISSNQKFSLNDGDILKFGKDDTGFKFITNKLSSSYDNNLYNSVNKAMLNKYSNGGNKVEEKNMIEKQNLITKNQFEIMNLSYNELRNEYNKLYAKHDALVHYASDLQKKNDLLELEIKQNKVQINKLENSENAKIILDKEKIIKILQNENNFYNKELQKLKECFNKKEIRTQLEIIISEYLIDMENYKRSNEIYKERINYTDKKWHELLKENELLKEEIKIINKKWNEDTMKFESIIRENDQRLNNALSQIPSLYNDFNVDKENAAKFLVKEVNIYLNEKNMMMNEIKEYKTNVVELMGENERLKDEICQISTKYNDFSIKDLIEKIKQLEDSLIEMEHINDFNKQLNYEKIITNLSKELNDYKNNINEMKQKIELYINKN